MFDWHWVGLSDDRRVGTTGIEWNPTMLAAAGWIELLGYETHVIFKMFILLKFCLWVRNDHTKVTAPHPVRSAKLSTFGLS